MVSREDKIVAFTEHGRDRDYCGMQNASKYYRTCEDNDNGVIDALGRRSGRDCIYLNHGESLYWIVKTKKNKRTAAEESAPAVNCTAPATGNTTEEAAEVNHFKVHESNASTQNRDTSCEYFDLDYIQMSFYMKKNLVKMIKELLC